MGSDSTGWKRDSSVLWGYNFNWREGKQKYMLGKKSLVAIFVNENKGLFGGALLRFLKGN